ncbi:MAG: hypothetical protein PF439_07225 [Helicobacteraceae bacterium]|jgi:uncharacterized metal-binding protein YceD (DUF177 family)|nr:hypothetical protein [Helicobacteraceae bacterium]
MNIPFRRITKVPTEFKISADGVVLKGDVVFQERNLALLQGQLSGEITLTCDICAEDFATMLNEKIELLISNGVYKGFNENFDVVEIQETLDLDELLHSEIELIRNDYHSCDNCKKQERN